MLMRFGLMSTMYFEDWLYKEWCTKWKRQFLKTKVGDKNVIEVHTCVQNEA